MSARRPIRPAAWRLRLSRLSERLAAHRLARRLLQHRFLKFGIVGASGTLVNLGVLYLCQEYLFRAIEPAATRLNASLATAIFIATINNFLLNRAWTWRDRQRFRRKRRILAQFAQYAMACWIGVVVQFVLTKLFAAHIHYLPANALAILLASLFNFVVNNAWTFRHAPGADVKSEANAGRPGERPGERPGD